MAYKNILVHVDSSESALATIQAAATVAELNGAHLTGIHVIPVVKTLTSTEAHLAGDFLEVQRVAAEERAAKAKAVFQKIADASGLLSQWFQPTGFVEEEIVRQGRFADLIVIGQSGSLSSPSAKHALENQVLLTSARPVLIVPYVGIKPTIGRHILVAWNGSMEATRAVNDAMPLLESADMVDVVSVVRPFDDEDVPSADLCLYLARHEVTTRAIRAVEGELSTSNVLLNRAADQGTDLIVMGAYGHSRLREWILGGATRNILKNMTVPVLMSH